ncbi:MAG: hypothetical protein P8N76_25615 [Pirellulaceae bacterium]|nr:hypothetical protein [Pirellulaceae bacterium]
MWDEVLTHHSPIWREIESQSETYTTRIDYPKNSLSPWITWPTLHRGIEPADHGARFLGQPLGTCNGEPLWEAVRGRGKSIGIFQSMGAWPAIDPGPNGFFVPDPFGAQDKSYPDRLEAFTRFCQEQVQQNESGNLSGRSLRLLLSAMDDSELTQTFWNTLNEQSGAFEINDLGWAHFKSIFNPKSPPDFSTYFTNSFAGLMHRHWDLLINRGLTAGGEIETDRTVESLEACLRDVLHWRKENPELIVAIASSMGQEQIFPEHEQCLEMRMSQPERLLTLAEIPSHAYEIRSAMIPQIVIDIKERSFRGAIETVISKLRTSTGRQVFTACSQGETLSLTHISPSQAEHDSGWIILGEESPRIPWEEAGFEIYPVKSATAYHIPEGILLLASGSQPKTRPRAAIRLRDVKELLLRRIFDGHVE